VDLTDFQAYWALENVNDSHGSNTLTNVNTATFSAAKVNNGVSLASASLQYLTIADNAPLSVADINFTCGGWFRLTTKSADMVMISKWNTSSQREYELLYLLSADRFRFQISTNGTAVSAFVAADTFGSPSTGTWYFVVFEHDADANEIRIRVNDGTPDATAHTGGVRNGTSDFRIGARSTAGVYWNGLIDEVFFAKRLLTSAELTYLYNSGNGRTYPLATVGGGLFRSPKLARTSLVG